MNEEEKRRAVDLLNADIRGEHQAILQYLMQAWALGERVETFEIEGAARDEMRHLRWLSDTVVRLGGRPATEHDPLPSADPWAGKGLAIDVESEQGAIDVESEQGAIDQYTDHIAAIPDPDIKRLLGRIRSDETAHRQLFATLAEELAASGREPSSSAATPPDQRMVEMLQAGVRHEYTVILQYLFHRFVIGEWRVADELEQQAINEMQHLGWLGEALSGLGVAPEVEHAPLVLEGDPASLLRADVDAERAVSADYTRQMEATGEPGIKELLTRIRDQEVYHDQVLTGLLEDLLGAQAGGRGEPEGTPHPFKAGRLTVGRLIGEKQI
ncbi:MAG: hypothetical protein M1582_00515 [Actinobacteria bacterium]|nr:hypothetical protein [Actinomycetota bacterium]